MLIMTNSYIVEYQSYNPNVSVSLPGPLLVTAKSLKVKQKLGNRIILTQNNFASKSEENDAPDILVGSIPLIHFADDGVTPALTYLRIPPPAPFKDGDIEVMWDKIRSSGCPTPRSVASQGRYAPGSAQTVNFRQITAEFLNYAHQQCRHLLSRWPINETSELIKRNIELGGGREDFPLTERNIGLAPIISTQENRRIPQQTFRRRSNDTRWKSNLLRNAASTVIKNIRSRTTVQIPSTEVDMFLAPFAAVAKLATTRQAAIDPPVSSWPFEARLCYESLLAAMAALMIDDQGTVPAPLSYLWRLYEAWISAVCLEAVMRRIGNPPMQGNPVPAEGCEWMARWKLPRGIYLTLIAQPYISAIGLAPPLQDIVGEFKNQAHFELEFVRCQA